MTEEITTQPSYRVPNKITWNIVQKLVLLKINL